jgi:Mg2+ and Co2+ transporter CorA
VFLIAHFHKASLLMFSDRLTGALSKLDANDKNAVLLFRKASRRALETFLRFTHRYWFHAVSNQTQAHDIFELCRSHLEIDSLFDDIRQEIQEMSEFLENEALRRQSDTMTRLTVVTTLGLIGTIVTGFLGMNILAWADQSTPWRLTAFVAVLVPTIVLTLLTVAKSRRLSDMMESLSDGTASWFPRFGRTPKL